MILPPCFLLFHFEEDEIVFGWSSSSSLGLVCMVWWLNKVAPFGLLSCEQDVRWNFIGEHLLQTPNMVGQPTGHRRRTSISSMFFLAQLLMRPTQIVGAANQ